MGMKIDSSMPNRVSMNVSIGKQSQGMSFGEKLNQGINAAGSAIANGAALVGGVIPGAGIISAAVSSVTNLTNMPGSTSAAAGYAATGVVTVGGGGMSTTVGPGGGTITTGGGTGGVGASVGPNITNGASGNQVGMMNSELSNMTAENAKLLNVQIALQRENQVFTSVSNAMKTKHDTVKNSISNIR